jgi:hypothetical protein
MKSLNHITPTGKLVRFDNINLIADVTPRLETYAIEALYKLDGKKIEEGERATENGDIFDQKFYDTLYNELDKKRFFEVQKRKTKEEEPSIA